MTRFNKGKEADVPEMSTASLPDIVFMLLFFFMTVTVMKSEKLKVSYVLPNASELKKLEKRDRVIYVHIGKPSLEYTTVLGTEPRIQINDKFVDLSEVGPYVLGQISDKPEAIRPFITIALKVDKHAGMGIVFDIKQELRKINALKINYTTYEGDVYANLK